LEWKYIYSALTPRNICDKWNKKKVIRKIHFAKWKMNLNNDPIYVYDEDVEDELELTNEEHIFIQEEYQEEEIGRFEDYDFESFSRTEEDDDFFPEDDEEYQDDKMDEMEDKEKDQVNEAIILSLGLPNEKCTICLRNMGISKSTLECKHSFHVMCLKGWLNESINCPICRNEIII
jgi:hypothetical protein